MTNQTTNLRIGLLDNSSHSLQRGYEMWSLWKQKEDAWLLKESVIWVHHGIELALKQLLVQTNEFLVFQDVDKAVERLEILRRRKGMENAGVLDLFEHDDKAISVGFGKLINRAAITLSISELSEKSSLRNKIDQLTKYRNSIVHFSIELNILEVSNLLSEILNPLLSLLYKEVKDENFKKKDIPKISKSAQPVQKYVEHIRREIIDNAINATIKALPPTGNGKAGIVWQALGTGLTLSLLSYVEEVSKLKQMHNKVIVIIVDRVELLHQMHHLFLQKTDIKPIITETKKELASFLESGNAAVIISTIQKIDFDQQHDSNRYLFIAHSLHSNSMSEKLMSAFPNATYILFTSSPPKSELLLFGKIVGEYGLQQAINDEVATPVKIEKHEIKTVIDIPDQQMDLVIPEYSITKSHQFMRKMAEYIIEHFKSRQGNSTGKGVIVTGDISTAITLFEHIIEIEPKWHGNSDSSGYVKSISSLDNINKRNVLLRRFRDPDDSLSLLIGTGSFLVGYDNPLIHTIYIISPVSRQLQYNLASLASRHCKGKKDGLIVDLAGMVWDLD